MYLQWGYGSGGFLKYIPFPTTSIILKKVKKRLDSYMILFVYSNNK